MSQESTSSDLVEMTRQVGRDHRFFDAKVIGYREYATWDEILADLGLEA